MEQIITALLLENTSKQKQGHYKDLYDTFTGQYELLMQNEATVDPGLKLNYLNEYANLCNIFGDSKRALQLCAQAWEIEPNAVSLNYIAMGIGALGYTAEAITYSEKSLAMYRAEFGEQHPDVATLLNNIGFAYADLRQYAQAQLYHEQALEIRKSLGSEYKADIAQSYNNLGMVALARAEYVTAKGYLEDSLSLRKKVLGAIHPDVSICINNLGLLALKQRQYQMALNYFDEAYAMRLETFDTAEQPAVMRSHFYKASCYIHLGLEEQALAITEAVLAYRESIYDCGHAEILQVLRQLLVLTEKLGLVEQSIQYQKRLAHDQLPAFAALHAYLSSRRAI